MSERTITATAIDRWREIVGSEHVLTDEETLAAAEKATFATTQRVPAIVRPADTAQVQECVRVANAFKAPIYPVSTGKNWGYGSRVPYADGCAILDLGRLNRIRDFSEALAYATIEAGVTQQQLADFLIAQNSRLYLSATGSNPDTSIIGNTMERGQCRGLFYERFQQVCGFEVVLPTGELIRTGFSRYHAAKAAAVDRWGVGPYLDGLFVQSNLGIVTSLSIWLQPYPKSFQTFWFKLKDDSQLPPVIESLRDLLQSSIINAVYSISNPQGVVSYLHQYPWQEAKGRTPLPRRLKEELAKKSKMAYLNGLGMLYSAGHRAAREEIRLIKSALKGKVEMFYSMNKTHAKIYRALRVPWRWATGNEIEGFLDFASFKSPSLGHLDDDGSIPLTYWRKKTPLPRRMDPDRDSCGYISNVFMLPHLGPEVRASFDLVEETVTRHGFEPNYGVRCSSARSVEVTSFIAYDREVAGEDERAMACHDDLMERFTCAGFLPGRLGLQSVDLLPPATDDSPQLLSRLKSVLDPNNILAPRRYEFWRPKSSPAEGGLSGRERELRS